ncbi:MAG TPA: hypothetical protein VIC08_00530 [Cellvibrionaceae bacterium]
MTLEELELELTGGDGGLLPELPPQAVSSITDRQVSKEREEIRIWAPFYI